MTARRITRRHTIGGVTAGALLAGLLVAAPAHAQPAPSPALDEAALDASLQAVHEAGIYGLYSAADTGAGERWRGAAGVADVTTGRPATPQMRHRVGSVTKSFVAVAVLQQVAAGRVDLDAPVGAYLPGLLPEAQGSAVTVRMLLNHTSGIGDYVAGAFPSLGEGSGASLDENRLDRVAPEELVRIGLAAPPTGAPGERHAYSNTNYIIAGLLMEEVTGQDVEDYLAERVIAPAGLRHTSLPRTAAIRGPHAGMYEAMYGLFDPPRDYRTYDPSWFWTAGALVSTAADLDAFYAALFDGTLLPPEQLAEMRRTVPVEDAAGQVVGAYGLGLYPVQFTCGTFWGHDGVVWGAGTMAFAAPDGGRQAAVGSTLTKYQTVNEDGTLEPHPADAALVQHLNLALCGTEIPDPAALPRLADASTTPLPGTDRHG
ncbi:serine hydrolase domain-containing protein [Streptomyces johnsoniae]|uniref:Serine hydrolase domain-containing protein n=1 Tax=Streptomyces johnsoniae TaxID=3075532 RepID=A0ABU2SAT6_9ACTN|nr:serine hydrolase domain-containing protein [Streptomyces sp. DSM 41886]MDT0445549.1 serine hydrolase domain-containing protein [Streptomyces sp. DSM 41886]